MLARSVTLPTSLALHPAPTASEFRALVAILAADSAPSQRKLAEWTGMSVSTIQRALAGLESLGLVRGYTIQPPSEWRLDDRTEEITLEYLTDET